jgi:hypothetical protein
VAEWREVAGLGAQELRRRLEQEPAAVASRDLSVLAGIATDKVAKFEGWGSSGAAGDATVDKIGVALARLAESGGVELSLSVTRPAAAEREDESAMPAAADAMPERQ